MPQQAFAGREGLRRRTLRESAPRQNRDAAIPKKHNCGASKDARVAQGQRVLVVDGLSETEEVLRAVLEPRGLEVDRIRAGRLREFAAKRRPSVVVVHVDDEPSPTPERWPDVPRILIGATQTPVRTQNGNGNGNGDGNGHGDHYLEKPFHYGELIRAIERALAAENR